MGGIFNPDARIGSRAAQERLLRDRATDEGAALFRRLGGERALSLVSLGLRDQSKTADERRHDRLMLVELERLDRIQRYGPPSQAIIAWKPPLFSFRRIKGLFRKQK